MIPAAGWPGTARPSVIALVSVASAAPVGVPSCQILHGHEPTAPVVKLHENGLLIGVPEAFCAPDTVAVYVVLPASELVGVNVATVSAPLKLTDPGHAVPAGVLHRERHRARLTGWENVADGATDTATPVAPEPGVTLVTAGGVVPAVGEYTTSTQ